MTKFINKEAKPKYKYKRTINFYYNESKNVEKSFEIIDKNNLFINGFFRYILENPKLVKEICTNIPKESGYAKLKINKEGNL